MISEKFMKQLLGLAFALFFPAFAMGETIPSGPALRLDMSALISDYKWAEYSDRGNKLLEETGNIYGAAFTIASVERKIGWRTGGTFFIGQVDYDGQTWTNIPVKTDVFYSGTTFFADVVPGYRFDSGLWLKSFAGLGIQFWLRDLKDTATDEGDPVSGAEEWWGCIYGRLGIGAEYPLAEAVSLFAEGGVKLPVYARNEANFLVSGSPSAGLEPDQEISGFYSIGMRWHRWGAKIAYDALRFDRSKVVSSGTYNLFQPRSESDVYRAEVFWTKGF